jgi:hypothetical protein
MAGWKKAEAAMRRGVRFFPRAHPPKWALDEHVRHRAFCPTSKK